VEAQRGESEGGLVGGKKGRRANNVAHGGGGVQPVVGPRCGGAGIGRCAAGK
jgi:hypothetical protein